MKNEKLLEFGSLFSGIGGLDIGLEQAGLKCKFQVENCLTIIARHWPDVPKNEIRPCMGIVGGDPCPIRSNFSRSSRSSSPDMSGHFLAMVYRCKPRWLLRENVCHPDAVEFHAALVLCGYKSVIVEMDSAAFTGQGRHREFLVGFDKESTIERFSALVTEQSDKDADSLCLSQQKALACLTTRCRSGVSIYSNFIYEGAERGLRCFTHNERESFQGFPAGWTGGIPNSARERGVGNAVTVPVAKWLGERIKEALINNQ